MHIPESTPQHATINEFPYQEVFRLLIVFAGCTSVIFTRYTLGFNIVTLAVIGALIAYLVVTRLLVSAVREKGETVNRIFSCLDAGIVGALIAFLDFSLLLLVLLALLVQFNALLHGGMRRLAEDGVFMVLGIATVMFLKGPALTLKTDLETNVATLLAVGLYISLYALFSQRQARSLKSRLEELEQEKVKLKLHNYHISKYLSPTLRQAPAGGTVRVLERASDDAVRKACVVLIISGGIVPKSPQQMQMAFRTSLLVARGLCANRAKAQWRRIVYSYSISEDLWRTDYLAGCSTG